MTYASDARGVGPFLPRIDGDVFVTPQFPTTLPTLDELLGRPEFPEDRLVAHYLSLIQDAPMDHLMTIHAELEGMNYLNFMQTLLQRLRAAGMEFYSLGEAAKQLGQTGAPPLPVNDIVFQEVDGRSGTLAVQAAAEGTR